MRGALLTALLVVVALLTGCSSTPAADAALCEEQEDGPMRHLHVDNGTDGAKLHENFGFWPHSIWAFGYRNSLADLRAYLSDERLASLEDEELRTTARVLRNNVEAVQRAAEDDTQVEPDDLDYLEDSLDELAEVCRRVG